MRYGLFLLLITSFAGAGERGPMAARLAEECDDLIRMAIKRPYGWAWGNDLEADSPKNVKARPVMVSLEPGATPSAGLLLLMASELLEEGKYAEAAANVGRGVAVCQQVSGKFPSEVTFNGANISCKETPVLLADRSSTRAALGLLLSLSDDNPEQKEAVTRGALRGAKWLMKQQSESGAWPVLYPAGSTPQNGTRIVRLDLPDGRDCALTMLLAYEVLGDPFQRHSVEQSVAFMLKARTSAGVVGNGGLWASAYLPTAQAFEQKKDFPPGFDTLASRYCMQTVFSTWAILGEGPRLMACEAAAKSLDELIKGDDGKWHRRFNSKGDALDVAPTKGEEPVFGATNAERQAPAPTLDVALAPTLGAIELGRKLGREKFRDAISELRSPRRHLALLASGLTEVPLVTALPAGQDQVADWLKVYSAKAPAGATELNGKVQKVWEALVRAQVEKRGK